jgi:dihydrofolate reductase
VSDAPRIVLVAAIAENGVIGRDDGLPWRLPGDLKHFRSVTLGKPVIMGRRTFAAIGRPLPGRSNIVLTGDRAFRAEGVHVASTLDGALSFARAEARRLGADEIAIIGGGTLYSETLPRADRLYVTEVHGSPRGDVRFPAFDPGKWREVSRAGPMQQAGDEFSYSFVVLERAE